ncbi:MAG: agmatinase [Candidatus Obscuribacterales bacterium]|nr:agmatinase [Candidatus Obscuribacterales bacterium]
MAKKTAPPKPASKTTSKKTVSTRAASPKAKADSQTKAVKSTPKKSSRTTTAVKSASSAKAAPIVKKEAEKYPEFLGLPKKFSAKGTARACIVPVPYEATTSYGKGTANGPKAILEASQEVELFDDELWTEPHKIGIHTTAPVHIKPVTATTKQPFDELYQVIKPLIDIDKFPIVLGGEHSLSFGAVKACKQRYKDLSILQIDAHADLRPQYQDNPYSHASVSYQIYNQLGKPIITQVGVRNISKEETTWMEQEHPKINIFWARNQDKWNLQEIVNTLSPNVYLTIDLDGLDSGIMPSTGTPEPGGIGWYTLMELIKLLCVRKNVVAADIVELAPIQGLHAPDFLAAKLIYKLIGYRYALDLGVTKKYL